MAVWSAENKIEISIKFISCMRVHLIEYYYTCGFRLLVIVMLR
jgi:hypothetical protein